jgi:hypothetical protein
LKGDDTAQIERAMNTVTTASHKLAEAMYAAASAQRQHAGPTPGPGQNNAHDADYTVVNDKNGGRAA